MKSHYIFFENGMAFISPIKQGAHDYTADGLPVPEPTVIIDSDHPQVFLLLGTDYTGFALVCKSESTSWCCIYISTGEQRSFRRWRWGIWTRRREDCFPQKGEKINEICVTGGPRQLPGQWADVGIECLSNEGCAPISMGFAHKFRSQQMTAQVAAIIWYLSFGVKNPVLF